MKKIHAVLVCLMLLVSGQLLAQSRTVTGTIADEKGVGIANASIVVKGTTIGTTSAENGAFSITVPERATTLIISAVGKAKKELNIATASTVSAVLTSSESEMVEVVVIGYGTQKKKAVTSSISSIKGNEIANLATPSFDKQLAGRMAGVQVTTASGIVNQPPRIRIRGVNSISQGRNPLFVIDGSPTFSSAQTGIVNSNPLSDINPSDIESIEVLKDGAATAIYGSRAANGAILITTKKGRAGKVTVNYDAYVAVNTVFNKPELLNAEEFVTISNEKFKNAKNTNFAKLNNENTNTDWLSQVFKKSPIAQSHTVSFSGGNDKTLYYFSVNYNQQDGVIRSNFAKRYAIRANLEHKVNQYVKIGNNITLSKTEDNDQNNGGNALSGAMGGALRALPNVRVLDPSNPTGYNLTPSREALGRDSNSRAIENNFTNIAYVLDKNIFKNDKYRIINNAFLEISPASWLTFKSQASVDFQTGTDFQSLDPLHGDGRSALGNVLNQSFTRSRYIWQNYVNINKTFDSHTVSLIIGTETQKDVSNTFRAQGTNITDPFFATNNIITGAYATQLSGGFYSKAGFQSYFGRLNYDYGNKYFVQVSLRRDGQSSLAKDKRFGNFPGASAGWRVSEEEFWKNSDINSIINDFKIRSSYAVVGNSLTGFPYLSVYNAAPYGGQGGIAFGVRGNPDLEWETNKKLNVGADLGFAKNRYTFSFDYFVNSNDNQVLDAPTPPSIGIPGNTISSNIGSMENKGFELALSGEVARRKIFSWNVNVNFTSVSNKVKSLVGNLKEQLVPGPNNGTFNILRIGQPINGVFGYEYVGVNSANGNPMWKKADGSLVQYNNVQTDNGYFLVVKPDDGAIGAASTLSGTTDRKILGSVIPKWFGGFTNTFTFKALSMEIFLRYSGGNKVYNLTRQEVLNSLGFVNNGKEVLNRWTTPGQKTDVPKLYYGRDNLVNLQGQANSRFLESGDFLRLQNLIISYNFKSAKFIQNTNGLIKSVRIYAQGQNLAVWSKYTGIDPENFTELGIDNSSVPQLKTYTLGINVGF
jgi:TonB-linked SusC/RagA family outer membrane protein